MTAARSLTRWAVAHLQALGVSFLLVVFAAVVSWFFASFVPDRRQAAIEGWRRELSLRADHERDLIERRILDVTEDLRFFAALPSVRGLLAPGPSERPAGTEAHVQGILSDFRHLLHQRFVSTLDASGQVRASDGGPACGSPKSQRGRATEQNRPRRGCCGERAMSAEGSATGGALWSP